MSARTLTMEKAPDITPNPRPETKLESKTINRGRF